MIWFIGARLSGGELTDGVSKGVDENCCQPCLAGRLGDGTIVLDLDVCCKVYVGKHLDTYAGEKRVSASQSINEEK